MYWLAKYARIVEPPTLTSPGGVIPFESWPNIKVTIDALQKHPLITIMKSRQIGESLVLVGWNKHGALFKDGYKGFFFSKGENESIELITKAHNIYDHLPNWMQLKLNPDSRTELGFPDRHSSLKAFPATDSAGVSFTASSVLFDEAEYMEYAEQLYANAKPVIDAGGQLVFCFTVDKRRPTTLAKSIFVDAYETRQENHPICASVPNMIYPVGPSKNGWLPIFFPYNVRPGRDEEWYERTKASIPPKELQGLTPELYMEQNYPRCLASNTLVGTCNGIVPISEAPDKSFSGVATVYRLTTKMGRILEGTPEHRILTPSGYRELGSLSPGDTIQLKPPSSMFHTTWVGLPTHFQGENRGLSIGARWARFLGIFAGDGSISGHYDTIREAKQGISVVVDSKDVDFLKMVEDDFDALFGAHNTRKFSKANCMEVRVSRHWLVELFKVIGMVKPSGKVGKALRKVCVPPVILQGPPDNARAFLQGVFETDGSVYVNERHSRIALGAKDAEFLGQVQFLLLGFGITSRVAPGKVTTTVRGKKVTYGTNTLTLRKPEIALFNECIGFLSARKRAECAQITGVVNNGFNKAKPIVFEDTVVSVEEVGESAVWDLVDQPDQCFSANGIWVHNSVEEALRATQTVAAVDLKVWDEMKKRCTAPVSVDGLDPLITKVWKPYQVGQTYVAASDTAHGVGKDYNVTVVMNVKTGEIVADVFNNWMKPDAFAEASFKLLHHYRSPKWFIEDNDWGATTIDNARKLDYPNLGYQDAARTKPGWHTGNQNRNRLMGNMITAFNTWGVQINNFEGLSQFGYLIRNMDKDGRIEAMKGKNDDYPTAVAICVEKAPELLESVSHTYQPIKTLHFKPLRKYAQVGGRR